MNSIPQKVVAYLQDIYPSNADAGTLSTTLGVNQNTLRGVLPRLVKIGDVERVSTGRYKAKKPRKPAEAAPRPHLLVDAEEQHGHSSVQG